MSLETNMRNALTRIATEFKAVNGRVGSLAGLQTTTKTSLVAAINELKTQIVEGGDGLTMAEVEARIQQIIGSAPITLDTFQEIASALGNDPNFASTIMTALGNRVRFDATQSLTAEQRNQVLANIGAAAASHNHDSQYYTKAEIGDVTTNFVAHFEAGLV